MAKRAPETDINHENWDKEDDPEDAGTFSKASSDVLKTRVIKTAKRRAPQSTANDTAGPFSGFTFSTQKPVPTITFGTTNSMFAPVNDSKEKKDNNSDTTKEKRDNNSDTTKEKKEDNFDTKEKKENNTENVYYEMLYSLNKSVVDWVSKHVKESPYCILSPVFDDYNKHLDDIETKYGKGSEKSNGEKLDSGLTNGDKEKFSFVPNNFSFFPKPPVSAPSSSSAVPSVSMFSSQAKASLGMKPEDKASDSGEEEKTDEVFQPVQEEGAVYSVRCKMFFKLDEKYKEQGIGTLFLKPIAAGGKTQMIFRADNITGTVLLNALLSASLPVKKIGSNNVMIICIPTPQSEPVPVTILLKVKTAKDADQLFENIERYKK